LAFVNDKTAANTMLSFTKSPSQNLRSRQYTGFPSGRQTNGAIYSTGLRFR
jgi:hypothetical protein